MSVDDTTLARSFSLRGATAVVTGGTQGLGKAIVEALCHHGCRVFTCARTAGDVETCVEDWRRRGYDVDGCVCDVSDANAREELARRVSEKFSGELNILVSNVGFNIRKPTVEFTSEDYLSLIHI